jgi:uncharacterized DUF497 family protein
MESDFEWDEAKAKANFVERLDDRKDYGEERFVITAWQTAGIVVRRLHRAQRARSHNFSAERDPA